MAVPFALAAALLAGPPAVVVESSAPAELWRHPLVRAVWAELRDAPLVRGALGSPELDAAAAPLRAVADRTGRTPANLLAAATAGGVRLELPAAEGGPAAVLVAAESTETRRAVLAAVRAEAAARLGWPVALAFPPDSANGRTWPLGDDAAVRVAGPTVALAAAGGAPPAAPPVPGGPLLSVRADLDALRAAGSLPTNLAAPWADAGLGGTLGGYAAALAASPEIALTLGGSDGLSLALDFPAAADVPGFFAPAGTRVPAPLAVPGAIYSASWHRDYGRLWEARRELLTEEIADATEARDAQIKRELSVLGADVAPSELFATLGDSWRVVVAGGLGSDDSVAPSPPLPAAGLAVSVRDAAEFARLSGPLLRGAGLVAAFGEANMRPFAEAETVGATEVAVAGLRFAASPAAARRGNRARFNLAPAWATHRGHFLIATNRPLLRALLAAVEADAAAPDVLPAGVTERQEFSPAALAGALEDAASVVDAALTLETGLPPCESRAVRSAVARALRAVGPVTVTTTVSDGLRVTVDVAPAEPSP